MLQQKRLPGLDGCRAIAIVLVMLSHYFIGDPSGTIWQRLIAQGGFGVSIFFVLSGFLITFLLLQEETSVGDISLKLFYARRALRILPPIVLFIFVLWLLRQSGMIAVGYRDLCASLFFMRNYIGKAPETGHLWTLAIEEQFYIAWPLFMTTCTDRQTRLTFCAFFVFIAPVWRNIAASLANGAVNLNSVRTDLRYDGLLIGCLLALLLSEGRTQKILSSRWVANAFVATAAMACIATFLVTDVFSTRLLRGMASTLSFCCVALILNYASNVPSSLLTTFLELPLLVWIGRLSYSIYLWQQLFAPAIRGMEAAWFRAFPANLVLAAGSALFSYYAVERPLSKFRSNFRHHTPRED